MPFLRSALRRSVGRGRARPRAPSEQAFWCRRPDLRIFPMRAVLVTLLAAARTCAAATVHLDAQGVRAAMASKRATVIKFVDGTALTGEAASLAAMWNKLEADFSRSGVVFASVDCSMHAEACEARKVTLSQLKDSGPIIKSLWGTDSFRRFAGKPELASLREYISKKLAGMTEEQKHEHASAYEREMVRHQQEQAQASAQSRRSQDSQARNRGQKTPDSEEMVDVLRWVLESMAGVSVLCFVYYLYLIRPFAEAPADVVLVSSAAGPNAASVAVVRVDPANGTLTPLSRVPVKGAAAATFCVAARCDDRAKGRAATAVLLHMLDVGSATRT